MKPEQNISKARKTFLNLTGNECNAVHGQWVSISLNEWIIYLEKQACENHSPMTDEHLRHEFLNFMIQAFDKSSYGAGCDFELFEERQ